MDASEWAAFVGRPLAEWANQCHSASLALVRTGIWGDTARVARGSCHGVGGQHSWVVIGDPYQAGNRILDPTLWSYEGRDPVVDEAVTGSGRYTPHGSGTIWQYGRPSHHGGETIDLHASKLDAVGHAFLTMLGPLDRKGWMELAHAPVGGWPARQIITAMYEDDTLRSMLPIDVVGMITDLNPDGLYR